MGEFTNHKRREALHLLRVFHSRALGFAADHPEASLGDFAAHLRDQVAELEAELDERERAAAVASVAKPLSGPLADPERQRTFRERQTVKPSTSEQREAWWAERRAVLSEIKAQGVSDALDWDCRECGAANDQPCHTAGGRKRDPHFLRATDAELPYLHAYGLGTYGD